MPLYGIYYEQDGKERKMAVIEAKDESTAEAEFRQTNKRVSPTARLITKSYTPRRK